MESNGKWECSWPPGEGAAFICIGGTRENKMVSNAVSGSSNSKCP